MYAPFSTVRGALVFFGCVAAFVAAIIVGTQYKSLSEEEATANAYHRGFAVTALQLGGPLAFKYELSVTFGNTGCTGRLMYRGKEYDPVLLKAPVPIPGARGVAETRVDDPTVVRLKAQPPFARCFDS